MQDVERVARAFMGAALKDDFDSGMQGVNIHAGIAAAMRETLLIAAEELRALKKGHVDPWMGAADWLKERADAED